MPRYYFNFINSQEKVEDRTAWGFRRSAPETKQ